jgi:DNA replication protein DnaC
LTIAGECGNGKTHLAAAIVNALLNRGVPVMFHTAPTLLDYLRATFAPDSGVSFDDRFDAIKTAQVLALDDLGAETATPWALDKLYQVLDHRYTWRLPTVVTTNVKWTSIPERVRSRLKDSALGKVVMNAAPDYRSIEGKKFYQAALKGARKRSDANGA